MGEAACFPNIESQPRLLGEISNWRMKQKQTGASEYISWDLFTCQRSRARQSFPHSSTLNLTNRQIVARQCGIIDKIILVFTQVSLRIPVLTLEKTNTKEKNLSGWLHLEVWVTHMKLLSIAYPVNWIPEKLV